MNPVKSIFLLIIITTISLDLEAQIDTVRNPEQFVFPDFNIGVARKKNGEKNVLNLNYNLVTEKMVFMQNNQIFDIINLSVIDTVFIEGKKFIPSGKVFYEVAVEGPATLYIQHKGSVKKPPRPAAYGGTSQVSSSSYINNIKLGNDIYRMPDNREIIIEPQTIYWIKKDYKMVVVSGKKSLLKTFADKKNEIKDFIGRSKFETDNPEHLKNLVIYYNSLPR